MGVMAYYVSIVHKEPCSLRRNAPGVALHVEPAIIGAMRRSHPVVAVSALGVFALAVCSQSSSTPTPTTAATQTSAPGGRIATDGDTVAAHYTGTLDIGEVLDSSQELPEGVTRV